MISGCLPATAANAVLTSRLNVFRLHGNGADAPASCTPATVEATLRRGTSKVNARTDDCLVRCRLAARTLLPSRCETCSVPALTRLRAGAASLMLRRQPNAAVDRVRGAQTNRYGCCFPGGTAARGGLRQCAVRLVRSTAGRLRPPAFWATCAGNEPAGHGLFRVSKPGLLARLMKNISRSLQRPFSI